MPTRPPSRVGAASLSPSSPTLSPAPALPAPPLLALDGSASIAHLRAPVAERALLHALTHHVSRGWARPGGGGGSSGVAPPRLVSGASTGGTYLITQSGAGGLPPLAVLKPEDEEAFCVNNPRGFGPLLL